MKKFAVIILLTFVVAIVISSCNRETCPAYSKVESNKTEHVG